MILLSLKKMNLFTLNPCSDERQHGFKLFKTKQRRSQKIVTDEDENRKTTAAEAFKKLDEAKNFIEVNGSDHLNISLTS